MPGARWWAPLAALGVIGCSGESVDDGKHFDGLIHSFLVDEHYQVIEGVEMCVEGRTDIPCVKTDSEGIGDLPVPLNEEMVVTYEKDGYVTNRRLLFSSPDKGKGLGTWIFQTKAWYDQEAATAQGEIDYSLGLVGLQSGFLGANDFALDPDPPDDKPLQFHLIGGEIHWCVLDCDLGIVGFVDVPIKTPPDKYHALFTPPDGQTCTPEAFACTEPGKGCVEFDVLPGVLTHVEVPCN